MIATMYPYFGLMARWLVATLTVFVGVGRCPWRRDFIACSTKSQSTCSTISLLPALFFSGIFICTALAVMMGQ